MDEINSWFEQGMAGPPVEGASLLDGVPAHHRAHVATLPLPDALVAGLPGEPAHCVVRTFAEGDWYPPHVVADEIGGHASDWVAVRVLDHHQTDGITHWGGDGFVRTLDVTGEWIVLEPTTWAWTRPVVASTRRVVAVGGRRA